MAPRRKPAVAAVKLPPIAIEVTVGPVTLSVGEVPAANAAAAVAALLELRRGLLATHTALKPERTTLEHLGGSTCATDAGGHDDYGDRRRAGFTVRG